MQTSLVERVVRWNVCEVEKVNARPVADRLVSRVAITIQTQLGLAINSMLSVG